MKLKLFSILFFLSFMLCGQNQQREIDSLLKVAEVSSDSIWFATHREIGFYYIFNNPEKAPLMIKNALAKAQKQKELYWESRFVYTYGVLKDVTGELDSARYYFRESLDKSVENNFKDIEIAANNGLGMNHWNRRELEEALGYFFKALQGNKEVGDEKDNGKYLNNIGLIYQELRMFDKALEFHQQALEIRRKFNVKSDIPASLNNIAICYREKGEFQLALSTIKEAIQIAKAENMQHLEYDCKSTLSNIYANSNETDSAIQILEELIAFNEENELATVSAITPYSNIINAYNTKSNPRKALEYINRVEMIFKDYPEVKKVAFEYNFNAAQTYFMLGKPIEGEVLVANALRIKDSLFSVENAAGFANLEVKFKVADKERALAESRANLAESELKVKQRNNVIYGSLSLAAIFGLLGYLFFNQQKLKNTQLKKESELKQALARIETQNGLQEQRLRISRDLHDNIGSQLTFVTSSVDNMKFGLGNDHRVLGDKLENISDFTTQTIYELRDTIWAMNKSDITIEDMQARIANFIDKARSVKDDIDFQFELDPAIVSSETFTSVQGMNIYRIIQEAVNNALKYADATSVQVKIDKNNSEYHIRIEDNGKGFDTAKVEMGNGLMNMKKRAKDLGGETIIESHLKHGTTVNLHFSS